MIFHLLSTRFAAFSQKIFLLFLIVSPSKICPTGSMDSYLQGRKSGEISKELAMIAGMAKVGLSKEQIDHVVEYSKRAWDPIKKKGGGTP